MAGRILHASVLIVALALTTEAHALLLDWDLNPWPGTATRTQTYTIGSGNVTVTLGDVNGSFVTGGGGGAPTSPSTNSFLDQTGQANLFLRANPNNSAPWLTVQIDFTHLGGVTDVSLSFLDLDSAPPGSFVDQIRIHAVDLLGNTFDPTSVTSPTGSPTWSWNGARNITGTSSSDHTASNWRNGTAAVLLDAAPLTSVRIEYRNNFGGSAGNQWIGISDIGFQPVVLPEPDSLSLLLFGLALLAAARRR